MRILNIDLSSDSRATQKFFGGYEGEHNATKLIVKLPDRMIGSHITEYLFKFETSLGEEIDSATCTPIDSCVEIDIWQQLTKSPNLKFCIVGVNKDEDKAPVIISKTASVELVIDNKIDGEDTDIDPTPVVGENVVKSIVEQLFDKAVSNGDFEPNIESVPGRKTTAGGEVFNNYESNVASALFTHSEGDRTQAQAPAAHSEGKDTYAAGPFSHAQNYSTAAVGKATHTQNWFTKAKHDFQTAMGMFNDNKEETLLEVGNGASDAERSNALEVYRDGRVAVGAEPKNNADVTTKKYVDNLSNQKVNLPKDTSGNIHNGTSGQVLQTNGDGTTEWVNMTGGGGSGIIVDQDFNPKSENAQSGIAVEKAVSGKLDKTFALTDSQKCAKYGNELVTSTGWITDGWTGSLEDGFTHISGNTNHLIFQMPVNTSTKLFQVSFKSSVSINTTNLFVTLGGSEQFEIYGYPSIPNIGLGIRSVENGNLEFIPAENFTGTISEISVKEIVGEMGSFWSEENSAFEIRATDFQDNTDYIGTNNLFIGPKTGSRNTSGNGNVGFGTQVLKDNTSGFWNTGIGYNTLKENTVGSRCVAVGYNALVKNITGHRNIAVGTFALNNNKTGDANIAIGADALNDNVSGDKNIAIGRQALYKNVSSSNNVAIGDGSMLSAQGSGNVAVGYSSGAGITTGSNNISIGINSMYKQKTGSGSVAIGLMACRAQNCTTGVNYGVFIGAYAGYNLGNASDKHIMIGNKAGYNVTTGKSNVLIGDEAGFNITTGSNCICIGKVNTPDPTQSNWLNIGNLIQGSITNDGNAFARVSGTLEITNLATEDPHILGRLWSDNGTLKVSAG